MTGVVVSVNGSAASNKILPGATIPAKGTAAYSDGEWSIIEPSGNSFVTETPSLSDTAASNTTPLAASTAGSAETAARQDHTHRSPGGIASIILPTSAIANSETQVVAATIPADLLTAGSTFRITAHGKVTTGLTPGSHVFKVRIGPTTLTGNIALTVTAPAVASITSQPFWLDMMVEVRVDGASGAAIGQGIALSTNASTGAFTTTIIVNNTASAVTIDTTVENLIELTLVTGTAGASAIFNCAVIQLVKM